MSTGITAFYCWQSDLDERTNRYLIRDALKDATKKIVESRSITLSVDHDTRGISGSPGITESIQRKIQSASVFIADLSIVAEISEGKKTPNPNVICEYGYAVSCLGDRSIIGVFNKTYGSIANLPFDINQNAIRAQFCLPKGASNNDTKLARITLAKILEFQITSVLDQQVFRGVGENERKLIEYFINESEHGALNQPKLKISEIAGIFMLTSAEVMSAVDELEHHGWLSVRRDVRGVDGMVSPRNQLFWDFDRLFLGHNARIDAAKIVNFYQDEFRNRTMIPAALIQENLDWSLRRLNPALTYLVENDYVNASNPNSSGEAHPCIYANTGTLTMARELTESYSCHWGR